jgi:hypothetical protein
MSKTIINRVMSDPNLREKLIKLLLKKEQLFRFKGEVSFVVKDKHGNIKGKRFVTNLVVNTGLYHVMDQLEDSPGEAAMGWAAIGDDNTAAAAGDTALSNELGRVALTSKIQGAGGNANQVTYSASVPAGTGTGTIVEAGLFNASSNGIMLARSVFSPIVKGAGDAIDITWVLTASAA